MVMYTPKTKSALTEVEEAVGLWSGKLNIGQAK